MAITGARTRASRSAPRRGLVGGLLRRWGLGKVVAIVLSWGYSHPRESPPGLLRASAWARSAERVTSLPCSEVEPCLYFEGSAEGYQPLCRSLKSERAERCVRQGGRMPAPWAG